MTDNSQKGAKVSSFSSQKKLCHKYRYKFTYIPSFFIFTFVILIALALIQTSCKSQKNLFKHELKQADKNIVAKKSNQNIFNDILKNEISYQNIQAKGKLQVGSKNTSATFKIIKDSLIQISIRPMIGIELMRIDITPSKTVLIDRLHSKFAELELTELTNNKIDFNFYNLQSLLTNRLFLPGHESLKTTDYKKFKYETQLYNYVLRDIDKNNIHYAFFVNAVNHIIETNFYQQKKSTKMIWKYGNFKKDNNQNEYPSEILAYFEYNDVKRNLGLSFRNWDVDKKINIDLNIPKNYSQVDLKLLISQYIKL